MKSSDAGYYKCSLPDESKSDVVRLLVSKQPGKYVLRTHLLKKVIEIKPNKFIYQVCTCSCSGLSSQNSLKITWYDRMGRLIKNTTQSTINTVLIRENPITKISIMKFSNLNESDAGIFSCVCSAGLQMDTVDFEMKIDAKKIQTKKPVIQSTRPSLQTSKPSLQTTSITTIYYEPKITQPEESSTSDSATEIQTTKPTVQTSKIYFESETQSTQTTQSIQSTQSTQSAIQTSIIYFEPEIQPETQPSR